MGNLCSGTNYFNDLKRLSISYNLKNFIFNLNIFHDCLFDELYMVYSLNHGIRR